MNNEKILNELNDKLDYMLDHLEDYTDNDIKSIVNQMNCILLIPCHLFL